MIKEVDMDGNGEIDFEEFKLIMRKMLNLKKSSEKHTQREIDV